MMTVMQVLKFTLEQEVITNAVFIVLYLSYNFVEYIVSFVWGNVCIIFRIDGGYRCCYTFAS